MPILNTPITTDEAGLSRILNQPLPVLVYLHDSRYLTNRPVDEAVAQAAKQYAGQVLIARVDIATNPQIHNRYDRPALPAIVALAQNGAGREIKSQAASIQPADVKSHIDYVLGKGIAPARPKPTSAQSAASAPAVPQVVTDATFDAEVLRSSVPVLVDFWAPWCGPCRAIAPAVEKAAQTFAGRARVVKVNVDENPLLSQRFQVMSIPTLMVFRNGQAIKRQVGANPAIIPGLLEEALR